MNFKRYLTEKSKDFYPDDFEDEDLEDEMEDEEDESPYGFAVADPEDTPYIESPSIPDLSVPIEDASDYVKSNSRIFDIYGSGSTLDMQDNQRIYEVIKVVKDIMDRHLFINSVQYRTNNRTKSVVFHFILTDDDDMANEFFLQGLLQYVTNEVNNKIGSAFDFEYDLKKNVDGFDSMVLTVTDTLEEEH